MENIPLSDLLAKMPVEEMEQSLSDFLAPMMEYLPEERLRRIVPEAVREGCVFLTTYNIRHFQPGVEPVTVLKPGDLVKRVRYLLAQMSSE